MKNDYLWDKTGEDAGIEALENALAAFRYEETAPPELPQKVFTLEKPKSRRFFQFGFALAAFTPVVIALSVVWFQAAFSEIPTVDTVAGFNEPLYENPKDDQVLTRPNDFEPVRTIEKTAPSVKPKVLRIRQKSAPIIRAERLIIKTVETKEPAETLTAEEKYAYDQLMLALSITGSKLKIVKDKIAGIEEQNAVVETER